MTQDTPDNLEKRIKKHIYGKPQVVLLTFPAGLGDAALHEVRGILSSLWFQSRYTGQVSLLKNAIRIDDIHLFAVIELLMRSQCLTDIRLVIHAGKAHGKFAFEKKCSELPWEFYLQKAMRLKLKVNSIASRAFHEGGLKDILDRLLTAYGVQIVSGENSHETTSIYADYYQDYLTVSISLAGEPLYKRGYRGVFSSSAPLREDAAASCLQRALQFARTIHPQYTPDMLLVPFSGTGTFLFEYVMAQCHLSPVLFGREYALQHMPLFRRDNFNYLLKKAGEHCQAPTMHSLCIDNSSTANASLAENLEKFNAALRASGTEALAAPCRADNFLEIDMAGLSRQLPSTPGHLFIPLNPPYGIRLGQHTGTTALYKKIANQLNELARIQKTVAGLILCPSEASWTAFCRGLLDASTDTCHFTQGGLDIRACQFLINPQ